MNPLTRKKGNKVPQRKKWPPSRKKGMKSLGDNEQTKVGGGRKKRVVVTTNTVGEKIQWVQMVSL